MADGPTIQRASERALAKGMSLRKVLELVVLPQDRCQDPGGADGLRQPDRGDGAGENSPPPPRRPASMACWSSITRPRSA
jgi:hypothetical protein